MPTTGSMDAKRDDMHRVSPEDEASLMALAAEVQASRSDAETQAILVRVDACVVKIVRSSI